MRSVTLAASALEVLLDETDEVLQEDAHTVVTFVRNILQSCGVEAFSLTADGPTVMDKVRRVLAEGGVLRLTGIAHINFS